MIEKIIALSVSILTIRQLWLYNRKTVKEIEKIKLEIQRLRRGG